MTQVGKLGRLSLGLVTRRLCSEAPSPPQPESIPAYLKGVLEDIGMLKGGKSDVRLVYTVAGGTGLGVIGYVRFEASGLYGAIDEVEATVKDEVKGVKADVQGVKESIARIAGQQEAILKLLGGKVNARGDPEESEATSPTKGA